MSSYLDLLNFTQAMFDITGAASLGLTIGGKIHMFYNEFVRLLPSLDSLFVLVLQFGQTRAVPLAIGE